MNGADRVARTKLLIYSLLHFLDVMFCLLQLCGVCALTLQGIHRKVDRACGHCTYIGFEDLDIASGKS
jgi:hypothetical protein